MKIRYLFLCFIASVLASCGEIDESNLKLYPAKLYLGVSGYNLKEVYDLGEESLVWDLYVAKSGYYDVPAEVELVYDPAVLSEYQELTQDGLDFEVLPENVATMGQKNLSIAADATLGGTPLTFNMATLRTLIPKDEEVKYVYPVRVKSKTDGVAVNPDKGYLLLAVQLHTPQANLRGKGGLIEAACDPWRNINMDKITVPLIMDLPFDNKDMELTFTYEVDPDLLTSYNQQNGTFYELLPDCYTTPELKIKAGEVTGTAEIEVTPADLKAARGGKEYLLPIRITSCDNPLVEIQEGAVTYLMISTADKTQNWTMTILDGETGIATSPGTVLNNVTLYMLKSMRTRKLDDANCKNIVNNVTDLEVMFSPGWGGTLWDQTTQAFKITDEDAGNGRKKVEIVYGWNGDITNYRVTNNNSWYDPANETLHIEYDGVYDWGSYSVRRNFTNPVLN